MIVDESNWDLAHAGVYPEPGAALGDRTPHPLIAGPYLHFTHYPFEPAGGSATPYAVKVALVRKAVP